MIHSILSKFLGSRKSQGLRLTLRFMQRRGFTIMCLQQLLENWALIMHHKKMPTDLRRIQMVFESNSPLKEQHAFANLKKKLLGSWGFSKFKNVSKIVQFSILESLKYSLYLISIWYDYITFRIIHIRRDCHKIIRFFMNDTFLKLIVF